VKGITSLPIVLQIRKRIVQVNAVLFQEGVNLNAGAIAE
jgi:hypothetical protein